MKHSDGPQITLDMRAQKYTEHLRKHIDRPGVTTTIDYLKAHGIPFNMQGAGIVEKYQLGVVNPATKDDEIYRGRLSIPYLTSAGVVAFKFRCVEDHKCKEHGHQKYLAPSGQETWIFNPEAFFDADDTIGIAEGEIDAIVATEIIGLPTIGIPGVDTWTANRKAWRRTLDDYERIIIFVDGDERQPDGKQPGRDMAQAIKSDVRGRARLVFCDTGEDVASMVASGKLSQLKERAGLE